MVYKLRDLIDVEHFQHLQDRLNKVYNFPSAIIDNDGSILTATAWQDVCTQFHRKNKECERDCVESDKYILSHINEANPAVSYRCPRGLVDNATPIFIEGVHYGNFFTGQFFLEPPDMDFFVAQARKYGFDEQAYLEAVERVPIWSQERLENYLYFIKGLIAVISESGLKTLREQQMRKQAEHNEARHRSILQTAMDGFWLTTLEGRLLEVNEAYCRMSGYSESELLAMDIGDLEANEDQDAVREHMQRVIEVGSDRFGSKHRRKDGAIFDVEISVQFRQEEGGRCVCFLRDISERKKAEERLMESAQRLQFATRSGKLAVWDWNVKDNSMLWDDRMFELYGISRGTFPNSVDAWTGSLHPDDRQRAIDECDAALRGEREFNTTFRILHPDGSIKHLKATGMVMRDQSDKAVRMIGINTDITVQWQAEQERMRLEAHLQQAQKMEAIGTLAGGIAHDFNNILAAILGFAEMAREDSMAGHLNPRHLDQVIQAGKRASGLVQQILAFARQAEGERIPVQPSLILKESLKMIRSAIPTTITIRQDVEPDLDLLLADPTQIHQIIVNLCTNAYHAMEETGGTLSVSLKNQVLSEEHLAMHPQVASGKYVQLCVRDTGTGIDPQIRERIFDPYFTTKEPGRGTGMGLAIVHGTTKRLGGFVTCESEIGVGTTFEVWLPVSSEQIREKAADFGPITGGTERILFVDDEEMLGEWGQAMLERLGYQVDVVSHSAEALRKFQSQPYAFDLVITDQTMPGMTGFDLAKRMLQIRPDLPIILYTGYSSQVSEERAHAHGIKGFALKPLVMKDIAELIRKVLS